MSSIFLSLTTAQVAVLTTKQIGSLAPADFTGLSTAQAQVLNTAQVGAITSADVAARIASFDSK